MKPKILGLLAVVLLAGPMAANAINVAPVAYSAGYTILLNTPFNGVLGASDADGDPFSFLINSPPAHGSVLVAVATGAFTYTPVPGYLGPDSFTFSVRDDGGLFSNIATISLSIVESLPSVPEPGTLALLGLGLLGLGVTRRKAA